MRAKEFITEKLSQDKLLSYIPQFIETEWPSINLANNCMLTSIMYSIIKDLNVDAKEIFADIDNKGHDFNLSNLDNIKFLLGKLNFRDKDTGEKFYVRTEMFEPTVEQAIGLINEEHPVILVFDSSASSPLMRAISLREKDPTWSGVVDVPDHSLIGYQYPPKEVPRPSPLGSLEIGSRNHAVIIVGYDSGEKTFVCRDSTNTKNLKGYLKFPLDLIKYTKLLAVFGKKVPIVKNNINEELSPKFVNKMINKKEWSHPDIPGKAGPKGATASVWRHMSDPDTVVKVVGGGSYPAEKEFKDATIAFVDFLVHNGKKSKHFPIVYGINVDDPEVVQVKIERLYPLPKFELAYALWQMSVWAGSGSAAKSARSALDKLLKKYKLDKQNSVESIEQAIIMLDKSRNEYKNKYKIPSLYLDLHEGNWLMTDKGVIVAADPWYAEG